MYLDDTAIVRKDAPNLFNLVPTGSVGATVENDRSTDPAKASWMLAEARRRYGDGGSAVRDGARWWNSGVVVADSQHADALVGNVPEEVDDELHGDQGVLNARLEGSGLPLFDLGWAWNWVGGFATYNAENRPMEPEEAWICHATTGLTVAGVNRTEWIEELDSMWAERGL